MAAWFRDDRDFGNIEDGLRATGLNGEEVAGILERSVVCVAGWRSRHPVPVENLSRPGEDVARLMGHVSAGALRGDRPWDRLVSWSATALGVEVRELVALFILEPYGALVDGLAPGLADTDPEAFRVDGAMPVAQARAQIEASFGWALGLDWTAPESCARAWHVSEEKLEPRIGERFEEDLEPCEQPLAPARDAAAAHAGRAHGTATSRWPRFCTATRNTATACAGLRTAPRRPTARSATTRSRRSCSRWISGGSSWLFWGRHAFRPPLGPLGAD